jgi:hypothetical protein
MAEEVTHTYLPEQFYEEMDTYNFIYFIQDYITFLREYLGYMRKENYITADDQGYYNSFIDVCEGINTDHGDDGTFEQYRATIEPLIEWMTEECGHMNVYHEEKERNALGEAIPRGVASRTRSKGPSSVFEIPPNKKGVDTFTLEPTKQEGVRIKLSDGKEYTYLEIKNMWNWNKTITPRRNPYTEEDKNKIEKLIDFATKGGKKTRKNKRKTKKAKKTKKTKSKKVRKNKTNNKRQH